MEQISETVQRIMSTVKMSKSCTDYKCKKCKDTGMYFYTDEDGYEYAKECEFCDIAMNKYKDSKTNILNLPDVFKDVTLDNFKTDIYKKPESRNMIEKNIKVIKYYLSHFDEMKNNGTGFYIYSSTKGSGKTRFVASIANELLKLNVSVKFATSMEILNAIKETWNSDGKKISNDSLNISESKLMKQLNETDVLIIDDFGVEKIKDWVNEKFYQIVNSRYLDKKIIITTSNFKIDEIAYDERIISRMKERSFCLMFPEESIREHMQDEKFKELQKIISEV